MSNENLMTLNKKILLFISLMTILSYLTFYLMALKGYTFQRPLFGGFGVAMFWGFVLEKIFSRV